MSKKIIPRASRQSIIDDISRVASELKRPPGRDEYVGRKGHKLGHYSEHAVKKFFEGGFAEAVKAAGLSGTERILITDQAGFEIANLKADNKKLNEYIRELEGETLSAKAIRRLIGANDTTQLPGEADWVKGPRELKHGITGIPTLIISDWHLGEVVVPSQINYVNEFNTEIAIARFRHTITTAIDLTKRYLAKPKYDGIICALGGDIVTGTIHEEIAETNDMTMNQTVLVAKREIIQGLSWLADEFGKVYVPCVVGNHGRHHRKPRFKFKVENNWEWLIYQLVAEHFKNDSRVSFHIPDGSDVQWKCYGRTYNMNHGDQFKGGTGIAGLFSPLMLGMARKQKRQQAVENPFDVMINGHWHQYIHTDPLIVNGSIKGYDEFAADHNLPFEPPQQALFVSHPTKRETFRMPVFCDKEPRLVKKAGPPLSW